MNQLTKSVIFATAAVGIYLSSFNIIGNWRASNFEQFPPASYIPVLNPDVTQATIKTTICVSGWTDTVRPPTSYTNDTKRSEMILLGIQATKENMASYELDHVEPLELGGAPRDPANLLLEPWHTVGEDLGAKAKDVVESYLHREVCAGRMTLAEGQRAVLNWIEIYRTKYQKK